MADGGDRDETPCGYAPVAIVQATWRAMADIDINRAED
jgi:hypothetical protein